MASFVWNVDPIMVHLGPLRIHYYGVVFVITLLIAYLFWRWQMLRGGYSKALTERFLLWGVIATLAGARLGHCLFYEPQRFLPDPISILYIWQGGLASHGATVGLVLALLLFARANRLRPLELMDRFTFAAAIGAAGIRLGNFVNSEIVGRVSNVPWAVQFPIYDQASSGNPAMEALPRHPSQLYEFALGLLVLLTLYVVDRWAGREKRPLGLLTGVFFTLYFAGRFCVEFFKETQEAWEHSMPLTMGQMLSMVPFLIGIGLLVWSCRQHKNGSTMVNPPSPAPASAGTGKAKRPKRK